MRSLVHPRLGIGAKLALSMGVGVVLIGTLIASEQFNSGLLSRLAVAATEQQTTVVEILGIEGILQKAQIAGRDLRKANTKGKNRCGSHATKMKQLVKCEQKSRSFRNSQPPRKYGGK